MKPFFPYTLILTNFFQIPNDCYLPKPVSDSNSANSNYAPDTDFVPISPEVVSNHSSPTHHLHEHDSSSPAPLLRRSTRVSQPPIHLQDYICNSAVSASSSLCSHTLTNMCIGLDSSSTKSFSMNVTSNIDHVHTH